MTYKAPHRKLIKKALRIGMNSGSPELSAILTPNVELAELLVLQTRR